MSEPVRWGIMSTALINAKVLRGAALSAEVNVVAVGSRDSDRSREFARNWNIPRAYGGYDEMLADPDVEAVYIPLPNSMHHTWTMRSLEAGKHVLCEKPFALTARQGARMVAEARARGLFLMEAIWSRYLPAYRSLVDVIGEGRIGDPLLVEADFGFRRPVEPDHRLFDLALGGGALLDLGIYPIQLCSLLLGSPEHVVADGVVGVTGVDEVNAAVLRYAGDRMGVVKSAIRVGMSCTARISGTDGWIDLPAFMHCPSSLTVTTGGRSERIEASYEGNGLRFEIEEVHRCLSEGLLESPIMLLDETLDMAATLDAIRAQLGVVYPGE